MLKTYWIMVGLACLAALLRHTRLSNISTILAIAAATMFAVTSVQSIADPLDGAISFSGGFNTTSTGTAIVSDLSFLDIDSHSHAYNCAGQFEGCSSATAFRVDLNHPGLAYVAGAYTFDIQSIQDIQRSALACNAGFCSDFLVVRATGLIFGGGYDNTPFLLAWTGQGTCVEAPSGLCGSFTTASWSSTLSTVTPTPVTPPVVPPTTPPVTPPIVPPITPPVIPPVTPPVVPPEIPPEVPVGEVVMVPTLSPVNLMVMAAIVLGVGGVVLRKQPW